MKKVLVFCLAFMSLALGTIAAQPPARLTHPLYPLKEGQRWTYRVIDLKAAQAKADPKKVVVVEVEKEEIYTPKKDPKEPKSTAQAFVGYLLKSTSGDKVTRDHVVIQSDGFYRVSTAGLPLNPPLPFFKIPQTKGVDTWDWEGDSMSGSAVVKGKFKAKHDRVTVPAGAYDAVAISFLSTAGPKVETETWYAKDIGMVKQHIRTQDHEIVLELQKFQEGK